MGGTSKTSQQTAQQNEPWKPAIPALTGLIGQAQNQIGNIGPSGTETNALNQLQANANAGNPFSDQITGVVNGLLGGGPDRSGTVTQGLSQYETGLSPYLNPGYLDPMSNPATAGYIDTIQNRISDNVNGMFAGAGRDLSGAHMRALGSGIAEGTAPVLFNQYNQNVQTQRGAQDAQLAARQGTAGILSSLDQNRFTNQQAGIDAAPAAQEAQNSTAMQSLMIEAMRRGIPIESLQQLTGILGPIAGLGGTSTGTASGTQQMSGAQQFALISGGLRNLFGGGGR